MEENKQNEQKKLTYEELQRTAGDLYQQNQKMLRQIQQMQEALQNRDFDYTSFILSMLFKVMDHPEMYDTDFVDWARDRIQTAMRSFYEITSPKEEPKDGNAD